MKVLIIGGSGMLGHKLVQLLQTNHVVGTTLRGTFEEYNQYGFFEKDRIFENIDVEDISSVERVIQNFHPQIIINAVGVIKQLPTAKDAFKTILLNSLFPHQLAEITRAKGIRLITIGTDCVFDGKKGNYTEADNPNAQDLYGKSKHLGEIEGENCLTLRTSIIGRELKTTHSLVEWFLSSEGKCVKGYTNAIFTGFPTVVFTDIIGKIIEDFPGLSGLYQVASKPINKYDLLKLIRDAYQADIEIESFDDFHMDRSLDASKFEAATGIEIPDWQRMIKRMAEDNAIYQK